MFGGGGAADFPPADPGEGCFDFAAAGGGGGGGGGGDASGSVFGLVALISSFSFARPRSRLAMSLFIFGQQSEICAFTPATSRWTSSTFAPPSVTAARRPATSDSTCYCSKLYVRGTFLEVYAYRAQRSIHRSRRPKSRTKFASWTRT
jgi:hypothetical protein